MGLGLDLEWCPIKAVLGRSFLGETPTLKLLFSEPPRVTSYAELGGSWNSEVNNGIHARQGSV